MGSRRTTLTVGLGLFSRGWAQLASMLVALVSARVLGQEAFGIYAIASVFVIMLQALMYGGIYDYIIKTQSDDLDADTCFWMNLGFGAAGALVIALLAVPMSWLAGTPLVGHIMLALAPSALVASFTSWQEALLLRAGRVSWQYGASLVTETLAGAVVLLALYLGFGVWSFVAYRYAQVTFAGAAYVILQRRLPRFRWHSAMARAALGFSSNIYLTRILGSAATYSSDLLIGVMVNPAAAGAFRLGSRIALGVSEVVYQPSNTIAWVHFSRAGRSDDALGREWLNLLAVASLVAWPALAGVVLFSHSVVEMLLGPGWDSSVPVLAILAVARMVALFEVFLDPLLGVRNRTDLILRVRGVAAVFSVAGLAVAAPFGATAAAIVPLLVALGLCVVSVRGGLAITRCGVARLIQALLPGLAATAAAVLGAALADRMLPLTACNPFLHLALPATAGTLAWAAVLGAAYRREAMALWPTRPRVSG